MRTVAEKSRPPMSERTVKRFEAGDGERQTATVEALQKVYAANGITFDSDGVNVRLEVKSKGRKS
jgi:hypothetical protein